MKRPNNVNDAQWQAITYAGEHLLISAGPGTGKTHTLTHRICYLLSKCQDHEHILAITFTNKASQEMRQRLNLLCPDSLTRIEASTFHAFCLTCLRAFASLAHLPKDFQVASALDIEAVTKEMWSDVQRKERQKRLQEISRYKNFVTQTPSEYLASYNHQLRKRNLLDFDDILLEALCLFRDNKEVLQEVQSRYRAIFVDEYQDINHVQHEILKLLVQGDVGLTPLENAADKAVGKTPFRFGNDVLPSSTRETKNNSLTGLTAIGDPHQAIYGFRGSDVHFFHDFLKDFPLSQHLSLSENYRSSGNLLEAAHQVIVQGPTLSVPALVARMHTQGRLVIYKASTERAEAEYVVHEIEKLVGGTSMFSKDSKRVSPEVEGQVSFGDIAILYRMNAQRKPLEEALERSGIPYDVSGELPLCEEKEVVALLPDLLKMRHTLISKVVDYLSALGKNPSHCLERLLDLAKQSKNASDFLDRLFLQRENEPFAYGVEKVSLLTLHAAKGLEFPVVFIAGCEEGILPLVRHGEEPNTEEERRLFYVGMTRAKCALYLTWAQKRMLYGKTQESSISSFVLDIEEKLKEYEVASVKARKKQHDQQLNLFKNF